MKPTIILILALVFFTIIGATSLIITKCFFTVESEQFSLTWFYNVLMFFSEIVGLPIYYIKYCISQQRRPTINLEPEEIKEGQILLEIEEEKPKNKNILLLIIPGLSDTFGSFMVNIGFAQLNGSISQVLRGSMIMIITFLISKCFLKNRHILDHYIAIPVALVGFILVGVSSFFGNLSTILCKNKTFTGDAAPGRVSHYIIVNVLFLHRIIALQLILMLILYLEYY